MLWVNEVKYLGVHYCFNNGIIKWTFAESSVDILIASYQC